MSKFTILLRKIINFITIHKLVFAIIFVLFLTLILLFFVNRALFQASTVQSKDASYSVVSQIKQILDDDTATSNEITSIVSSNFETLQNDMLNSKIGYPQTLALLTEPLSSNSRHEITQIYRSSDTTDSYAEGLKAIKETQKIVTSLPSRESIETNTDEFIKRYEAAYNTFRDSKTSLDLDTVIKITEIVRDSAIFYKSNGDIDVFYSRYDNVFSEMEKELVISYSNYLKDAVSFFDVYYSQLKQLQL